MTIFTTFAAFVTLGAIAMLWFFRGTFRVLANVAADHARVYALAYFKCLCLVAIAVGLEFSEVFSNLTADAAKNLSWWSWACLAWKPIAAGLTTVVGFLDRSAQRATENRPNTPSPFSSKTQ